MSRDGKGNPPKKEKEASKAAVDDENDDSSSSSSSSYSDEEDEDLVLEGVLVRNPDASDSDDSDDDDDDSSSSSEDSDDDDETPTKPPPAKKQKQNENNSNGNSNGKTKKQTKQQQEQDETKKKASDPKKKKTKPKNGHKKNGNAGPEIVDMEFTFCDMGEQFFHGIKNLLASSSPAYAAGASALGDLMIENVSVGTVISTDYRYKPGQKRDPDYEGVVYGFASVLNVTTYGDNAAVKALKKLCLSGCPERHKPELETVLSGTTKRPAGFFLQSRMVNLPLEIVDVLHQQLIADMDWAVENAGGGPDQRKSLDFGAFVRIAPTYREKSGGASTSYYKYFDDELLADHAEFTYEIELPRTFGMEETPYCSVVVLTKTGHREAVKHLKRMVHGDAGTR